MNAQRQRDTISGLKQVIEQTVGRDLRGMIAVGTVTRVTGHMAEVRFDGTVNIQTVECFGEAKATDRCLCLRPLSKQTWFLISARPAKAQPASETTPTLTGQIAPPGQLMAFDFLPNMIVWSWHAPAQKAVAFELQTNSTASSTGATTQLVSRGSYFMLESETPLYARLRSVGPNFEKSGWTEWVIGTPGEDRIDALELGISGGVEDVFSYDESHHASEYDYFSMGGYTAIGFAKVFDTAATVNRVHIYMRKSGTPDYDLTLRVYTSKAGMYSVSEPDTLVAESVNTIEVSELGTTFDYHTFEFSPSLELTAQEYWFVLESDEVVDYSGYLQVAIDYSKDDSTLYFGYEYDHAYFYNYSNYSMIFKLENVLYPTLLPDVTDGTTTVESPTSTYFHPDAFIVNGAGTPQAQVTLNPAILDTMIWQPLIFNDDIVIFDHDIVMVKVEAPI